MKRLGVVILLELFSCLMYFFLSNHEHDLNRVLYGTVCAPASFVWKLHSDVGYSTVQAYVLKVPYHIHIYSIYKAAVGSILIIIMIIIHREKLRNTEP